LIKEQAISLSVNAGGTDSRGIVIDPTQRLSCKQKVRPADPAHGRTAADVAADKTRCARLPARVFFTNRTPSSLVLGEIGGGVPNAAGDYNADLVSVFANVPLLDGPSKLFLAPVVDATGAYALRVFIVCFDTNSIFVYDPDAGMVENIIKVGPGPYAMTFDPFTMDDVAAHAPVPDDPRNPGMDLKKYRFAYVASFTNSYIQVIDLDNARPDKTSFEKVVFTLGSPTIPRGS
jgi:hypothetical protein